MADAFHKESIVRYGGEAGLRDVDLLESALARPRNLAVYRSDVSLFDLAAAYCAAIVGNHPYVAGNKRAGLLCAAAFLSLNGYDLQAPEAEMVEMIFGLAEGRVDQESLAAWLERNSTAQ